MEPEPTPDVAAATRFDGDMVVIYRRTCEAFDYWPNYFLRMVRNVRGVAAARKLVGDGRVSAGFLRLVKARRLLGQRNAPR